MPRILQVVWREYRVQTHTKGFVIGTVVAPLFLIVVMFLPALLMEKGAKATSCAVLDQTGVLFEDLVEAVAASERTSSFELVSVGAEFVQEERFMSAIRNGEFEAFLHIPGDVFDSSSATYYAKGMGVSAERIDNVLTTVVTQHRLTGAGLDPARVGALTRWVSVEQFQISDKGDAEKKNWDVVFITAFMFIMMLYITIISYGGTIMNSTVEEKSNRVVEVLLAKLDPFELLTGKLVGTGLVGFTQYLVWVAVGATIVKIGPSQIGFLGEVNIDISGSVFGWFLLFFLLGYFSMASLYAAVGSTCNSPQESQQLQFPLIMPMLAALMLSYLIIFHPNHPWGVALSFVPLLSPILMFVRIVVQTPPLWQILLAVGINLLTIWGGLWLASRIYRIGILMYGKRPNFRETLRWVRAT
jgi:ABC-2 type transport system permease protein